MLETTSKPGIRLELSNNCTELLFMILYLQRLLMLLLRRVINHQIILVSQMIFLETLLTNKKEQNPIKMHFLHRRGFQ